MHTKLKQCTELRKRLIRINVKYKIVKAKLANTFMTSVTLPSNHMTILNIISLQSYTKLLFTQKYSDTVVVTISAMYHALTQTMHVIYVHHFMIKNPLFSCCIHTTQGLLCILNPIWYAIMSYAFTIISLKTYKRCFSSWNR